MPQEPDKQAYLAAFPAAAERAGQVRRGPALPTSDGTWSFFFVAAAPGHKLHPAAVGPRGQIVQPGLPVGWGDLLLATPDLGALQERIGWLNGSWMSLRPGTPPTLDLLRRQPDLESVLSAPTVSREGGAVVFQAWYAEPPARTPFRVTLRSTVDDLTVERHRVDQLP